MNHTAQPPGQARYLNGNLVSVIATDYGGTISLDRLDHLLGQKPVDPAAAAALRVLHDDLGIGLVLASNTQPHETRWPALQQAGIDGLFSAAVLSYPLGVRKPSPAFYRIVLAAAGCPAAQVLFVGGHLENDAAAPARHGMRAALVRPRGLRPGEVSPTARCSSPTSASSRRSFRPA